MRAALIRSAARCSVLLAVLSVSACAQMEPVAPWQKGMLARQEMRFGADRLEGMFGEHMYSSKEGASGGTGEGGGGCGCY